MLNKPRSSGYPRAYHGRNAQGLIHNDCWVEEAFLLADVSKPHVGRGGNGRRKKKNKTGAGSGGAAVLCVDVKNSVAD